jgi:hypothetical protein
MKKLIFYYLNNLYKSIRKRKVNMSLEMWADNKNNL